ncbi:SDR family NAD(P)-dependent oxidoreductase [Aquibium microcysteis]|uniref:SDR family NAD(P)-dependent oxidoreductase n=1 Tax=Aquibium microcysteis TaxID=675281 RepID=UPI00165D15BC|nr:SDR family oxidoreductase [Aquibium microcysteis]
MSGVAVFGGSGRLGAEVVRHLAAIGPVHFAYHSKGAESHRLAEELGSEGRHVRAVQVDVRDAAAVESFLSDADRAYGLSAVVSANGAPFPVVPFHEADEADFRRIVEIDVFGTFHIMKAATRLLAARGGGAIVVFLTAAVMRTAVLDGLSSISKTAVAGMIRQLARDAGPLNVRVNGIAPGVVDTDKLADVASLPPHKRRLIETFIADTPLPRLNNPQTIAALTAFLTTPVAADISGQIIGADGGYSA